MDMQENYFSSLLEEASRSYPCTPARLMSSAAQGNVSDMFKILVSGSNVHVNQLDEFVRTPLHYAVYYGNIVIVKMLLEYPDLCPNISDVNGLTPILLAALGGKASVMKLLLEHPTIEVNSTNKLNQTALILATDRGHTDVVAALLDHPEIDMLAVDCYGLTCTSYAHIRGFTHITLIFKNRMNLGNMMNRHMDFINATLLGKARKVQQLLDFDPTIINLNDFGGSNAIHYAAGNGSINVLSVLMRYPSLDINRPDSNGKTAILLAIEQKDFTAVKLLLQHPYINVAIGDTEGQTPLRMAATNEMHEVLPAIKAKLVQNITHIAVKSSISCNSQSETAEV